MVLVVVVEVVTSGSGTSSGGGGGTGTGTLLVLYFAGLLNLQFFCNCNNIYRMYPDKSDKYTIYFGKFY